MIAVNRHVGTLEIDLILPQSEFCFFVHDYFTGCELQGQNHPMGLLSCGAQTLPHTLLQEGVNHSLPCSRAHPSQPKQRVGERVGHPTAQEFQ